VTAAAVTEAGDAGHADSPRIRFDRVSAEGCNVGGAENLSWFGVGFGCPLQNSRSVGYKPLHGDRLHIGITMTVPQSFLARSAPLLRPRCLTVAARRAVTRQASEHHSFTAAGDGIMAVFGAPVALEDHAIRACLAALGIQEEAKRLAAGVQDRDGVELGLRGGT